MLKIKFIRLVVIGALLQGPFPASFCQDVNNLRLKDYRPVSIFKVPRSNIEKAKYPVIDFHSHDYPKNDAEVDQWVKNMDETGIAKTIILSGKTGASFDSVVMKYSRYKDRFETWCGFDYTGADKPGWEQKAVAELERCFKKGAKGVGELGDKGLGELNSDPTPGYGIHVDDPRLKPLFKKCGDLHMPVNIHVAEDAWMYLKPDSTNDGLMNSATWNVDLTKKGILGHDELIGTLENVVRDNPQTIFIACHLANTCADLSVLGKLFDTYSNLYADIGARYAEISPIPKFVHAFLEKYSGRVLYGTDMGFAKNMYHITFRILESADEHFYEYDMFGYHWPLYGLSLTDETLKKIYNENGKKLIRN